MASPADEALAIAARRITGGGSLRNLSLDSAPSSLSAPQLPSWAGGAPPHHPGLFGQISSAIEGAVTGLPRGIAHMAGGVAYLPVGIARDASDQVRELADRNYRPNAGLDAGQVWNKYFPIASELQSSFGRTASDVIHPTHFARAYQQGQLGNKLLEDVGNATIVVGGAGSLVRGAAASAEAAATAARTAAEAAPSEAEHAALMQTAQEAADRAAQWRARADLADRVTGAANKTAAAPARVYTEPLRLAGKALSHETELLGGRSVLGALGETNLGQQLGEWNRQRMLTHTVSERFLLPARAEAAQETRHFAMVDKAAEQGVPEAEQYAIHLVDTGTVPLLRRLKVVRDALARDPQLRPYYDRLITNGGFGREQGLLDRSMETAIAYNDRALPPEQLARMDKGASIIHETTAAEEARKISEGVISPENLLHEPRPSLVEKALPPEEAAGQGSLLTRESDRLAQGPLEVAPGPYRPALLIARSMETARDALASELDAISPEAANTIRTELADIPTTMEAMQAEGAGEGVVRYTPGAPRESSSPAIGAGGRTAKLPREGRESASRQKVTGTIAPTFRAAFRKLALDRVRSIENAVAQKIAESEFVRTPKDVLPQSLLTTDDVRYLTGEDVAWPRAHDVAMEMKNQGYRPWDPKAPTGSMPESRIRPDTMFLPDGVIREFSRHFGETRTNRLLGYYDMATRGWKHQVLAFSPSWNFNNIIGNAMMTTFGAGVAPWDAIKYGKLAKQLLAREKETGQQLLPARLFAAGPTAEAVGGLYGLADDYHGLMQLASKSYAVNEFVDTWARSTVYLAKRAEGFSEEAAVGEALKALGDFTNMSPFERDYVRRVLPFYAWARHITKLAWHLSIEHPFRVAWTLGLSQTFAGQEPPGTPGYLQGAIGLPKWWPGGQWLTTGSLNPFSNNIGSPFTAPSQWPAELARSLNPVLKTGAAIGNLNFNATPGRFFSRPHGFGPTSSGGNPAIGLNDLASLTWWLRNMVPAGRLLTAVHDQPLVRYDTGQPVLSHGATLPSDASRGESILRAIGIPFIGMSANAAQATQNNLQTQADLAKARARYLAYSGG